MEEYRQVDIRRLKREGLLEAPEAITGWEWTDPETGERKATINLQYEPEHKRGEAIRFRYKFRRGNRGEWEKVNLPVPLEWTPCNFGGERPWFRCPRKECGRRCAILYLARYPVCRECLNLTYPRCNYSKDWEVYRHKLRKIAEKLGVDPQDRTGRIEYHPEPPRPLGMHTETYEELIEKWHILQVMAQKSLHADLMKTARDLAPEGEKGHLEEYLEDLK